MQTFKEVFRREEERQNLKNVVVCLMTVFVLITGAFALMGAKFMFESGKGVSGEWAMSGRVEPVD